MDEMHSDEVVRRVKRLRTLARLLDEAIAIPGTRIRLGIDSIIGLVPGLGDAASALMSTYIISEAAKLGLPKDKILKMFGHVAIDLVGGSIPLLGDVFDVVWKANKKNLAILEEFLARHETRQKEPFVDV